MSDRTEMILEYTVTDRFGKETIIWAASPEACEADASKLTIRDKIINYLDLSREPYYYSPTGEFKVEELV